MKWALLVAVLASMVVAAGYYGLADQIAEGFKLLAFVFGGLIILGSIAGGVKVSGPRGGSQGLPARVSRSSAA